MLTQEQIVAAHQANLETLFGLTHKTFDGVEKLVELNLRVAKVIVSDSIERGKRALSARDAQELLAAHTASVQPLAEKALAYNRHLYEILSDTHAEFGKVAEAQIAESQSRLQALVDNLSRNAPAGSESAVALVKSAISVANNAYDSAQKATKQAVELAESSLHAAANIASRATTQAHAATSGGKKSTAGNGLAAAS